MAALPRLNRSLLDREQLERAQLPEKAMQFGTGALLRGLIDYFLEEANRQELFGGRVVAVGSTGSGRDRVLNEQDGLYTLAIQGVDHGVPRREYKLITSVSRALSAVDEWDEVLRCAYNPALELIFSNTTEVGIALDAGDSNLLVPPRSFPGKLTRFLFERATAFNYSQERGVIVLPCELIEDNGTRLKEIVRTLAREWSLGNEFERWLERAVPFCNTLVDRIVPGELDDDAKSAAWEHLGYRDDLLTACEVYCLYAVEADDAVADRLGFAGADPGVIVARDITPYRERKVRLLNGTHTIVVPAALLCGCETVGEVVEDERVGAYLRQVLFTELVPGVNVAGAEAFAQEVLDRFSNPYIRHALLDITLQQTMKLRVRIVPSILSYAAKTQRPPAAIAFGFAAFLLYLRGDGRQQRRDDHAERLRVLWRNGTDPNRVAHAACADYELWETDLSRVPGFAAAVGEHLQRLLRDGPKAALDAHLAATAGNV